MDKLTGLHPVLVEKLHKVIAALNALGFDLVVVQGVRTAEQQAALYAQGRIQPGPKVTNCDGVKVKSNHQTAKDGFGHAADCAFRVSGAISFAENLPWHAYGECAKAVGLRWGGDFKSLPDRPHVELP